MASRPLQVWHVCRFEVARRLRSVSGIVALVSLIIASAVVGRQLAEAGRALQQATTGQDADAFRMMTEMVASMADFPLDTVRATLEAHAPPLVGAFAFLMLVMPLLALTMGYDQCAGDIETRHVRYLVFRIDRTTLYLGKLLGAWALISLTIAVAAISMAGYIQVGAGTVPSVGISCTWVDASSRFRSRRFRCWHCSACSGPCGVGLDASCCWHCCCGWP